MESTGTGGASGLERAGRHSPPPCPLFHYTSLGLISLWGPDTATSCSLEAGGLATALLISSRDLTELE